MACSRFIPSIGECLKSNFREFFNSALLFSVRTISDQEVIYVRYLENGNPQIKFAEINPPIKEDAKGLLLAIEDALKSSRAQGSTPFEKDECLTEIDKKLVNCNFECVSVMSGHVSVQARIKQKHPAVVYTDCIAHRLELAVLDSIKCDNYLKEFDKKLIKYFISTRPLDEEHCTKLLRY